MDNKLTVYDLRKQLDEVPGDYEVVFQINGQLAQLEDAWKFRGDSKGLGYYFINVEERP